MTFARALAPCSNSLPSELTSYSRSLGLWNKILAGSCSSTTTLVSQCLKIWTACTLQMLACYPGMFATVAKSCCKKLLHCMNNSERTAFRAMHSCKLTGTCKLTHRKQLATDCTSRSHLSKPNTCCMLVCHKRALHDGGVHAGTMQQNPPFARTAKTEGELEHT